MSIDTASAPVQQSTATTPRINIGPGGLEVTESGLESLKLFEREIAAYRRQLPRWLEEGQAWKHVLIKGDEVLGIWDAQGDAIDAGRERFGLEPIYIKKIDPRDPERFALLDAWKESQCQP